MDLSRRQFLGALAGGAALGALGAVARGQTGELPRPGWPGEPNDHARPRSRLLVVGNPVVVKGPRVSEKHLGRMLDAGLTGFTGQASPADAWRSLVRPGEKVAVKFNRSAAATIATTDAMLKVLLASLVAAEIPPGRTMLLDVTPGQQQAAGTHPPVLGYQDEAITVLERSEHLASALGWADCLINVPFIKDHHLAGVTCAMKNLSHGLIKGPAQWHGDHCRDSIPHLFALPAIRDKLRITICNGLRIVFNGGPGARPENLAEHSRLIFAADPVALDAHAARVIDQARGARGLRDLAEEGRPPYYLTVARDLKLGQCDLDRVDVTEIEA